MRVLPQQLTSVPPPAMWRGWPAAWRRFDGHWVAQIGGAWYRADGIWRRMANGSEFWEGVIRNVDGTFPAERFGHK